MKKGIAVLTLVLALGAVLATLYYPGDRRASLTGGAPSPIRSTPPDPLASNSPLSFGASQSTPIIFAGISGLPPRFIESGPNRGTGWLEYETQEVRKGMEADGFRLQQEYFTPARIAHEFQKGSPICTFPFEWTNPKQTFASKPDRLYTIALDFDEESGRSILFNRDDQPRFQKHLDRNGNLILDHLLEDPSLKLVLVRNKDYGALTRKLTELDANGDQVVREAYKDHVYLMLIKDNRQLVEMLNAKRFDYIFSDHIEDQDLKASGLSKERFVQVEYSTSQVKDLKDPALTQVSIVCAVNPETQRALPYFNKWIALNRGSAWKDSKRMYRNKVDPRYRSQPVLSWVLLLAGKFSSQLANGDVDAWYPLQQRHFSGLQLFPSPPPLPALPALPKPKRPLLWHALTEVHDSLVVLSESQFYHRSILDADRWDMDAYLANVVNPWDHRHLYRSLTNAVNQRLLHFDFEKEAKGVPRLEDLKSTILGAKPTRNFTLFASGLIAADLAVFEPILKSPLLESLTVFDAAPEVTSKVLSLLASHANGNLKALSLTNCSFTGLTARSNEFPFKHLKQLQLNGSQLTSQQLAVLLPQLSVEIESLSLGNLITAWSLETARIFGSRVWPKLRHLDLSVNSLDRRQWDWMIRGLPPSLETLEMGANCVPPEGISKLLQMKFPNLKILGLGKFDFASPLYPAYFPKSVESLSFPWSVVDASHFTLPPRLTALNLSEAAEKQPVKRVDAFFSRLGPQVSILNLSLASITIDGLRVLAAQKGIQHIERLDLSGNQLGDEAMEVLSQAPFTVSHLNLDNNSLQNRGAEIVARRWLPKLKSLNLSFNPVSEPGVKAIAENLPEGLERLELASLYSLDAKVLAERLPKSLKILNLSSNQLTDRDLAALGPQLPRGLYHLSLSRSSFGIRGVWSLANAMPEHLTVLEMNRVPIESEGIELLAQALPQTVTELSLGHLNLKPSAVEALVKALPPQLRSLEFEKINWSEASAEKFLASLPKSVQTFKWNAVPVGPSAAERLSAHWPEYLRFFQLSGAGLGNQGVKNLSRTLPATLERIELEGNQLTDEGLVALSAQPLEQVKNLYLGDNMFASRGISALNSKKRSLNNIVFTGCHLDAKALAAFGPNVLDRVRRFRMGNNPFTNSALIDFVKKMSPETWDLQLASIGFTYEGIDRMIAALPPNLIRLVFSGNEIGEKGNQKLFDFAEKRRQEGPLLFVYR